MANGHPAQAIAKRKSTMAYAKNITANPVPHTAAWRAHKAFPVGASIHMLVTVPRWRPGSRGADFYAKVLSQSPATVGDAIAMGAKFGYSAGRVQSFLRFLYTWGDQIEIDGKRYVAVVPVSTPKQAPIKAPAKVA
jgi:hypothetical protein